MPNGWLPDVFSPIPHYAVTSLAAAAVSDGWDDEVSAAVFASLPNVLATPLATIAQVVQSPELLFTKEQYTTGEISAQIEH